MTKNARTGVASGFICLPPLATMVSDGRITLVVAGDLTNNASGSRGDLEGAREVGQFM